MSGRNGCCAGSNVGLIAGGIVRYTLVPNGQVIHLVCRVALVLDPRLIVQNTALLKGSAQRFDCSLVEAAVQVQFAIRHLEESIRPVVLLGMLVVYGTIVGGIEQRDPQHALAQG